MISDALLSKVLGRGVKEGTGRIVINDNLVTFAYVGEDMWTDINIHELAHKCKEWALEQGYVLVTHTLKNSAVCSIEIINNTPPYVHNKELLNAGNEQSVIFLSCEWIMKETKC